MIVSGMNIQPYIIVILCFLLFAGCRSKKEESVFEREAVLEEYDLSPMFLSPPDGSNRSEASHDFYYTNHSDEDVELTLHGSSCGCTRVEIVPERIAPGETATISLAFDLSYSQERRSETVVVNTNKEYPKQIAYRLTAATFPRLELKREKGNEIVCDHGQSKLVTVLCRSYRPQFEDSPGTMVLESSSDLLIVHPKSTATDNETLMGDVIVMKSERILEVLSPNPSDPDYNVSVHGISFIFPKIALLSSRKKEYS